MNGTIAQAVALTCHANAHLQGRPTEGFLGQNSTCQFCRSVTFVQVLGQESGKPREDLVARNPDEWFARLLDEGARGVELRYGAAAPRDMPERMLAGFVGGGGQYALNVRRDDGEGDTWLARWEVGDRNATDRRIWRVTYGLVSFGALPPSPAVDLAALSERLEAALVEITAFAERHSLAHYASCFRRGIACLRGPNRQLESYHRDLAPPHVLPEIAEALLHACQPAWVFGGMGSWNDISIGDGTDYERVSQGLYSALVEAIPAAANASSPEGGSP